MSLFEILDIGDVKILIYDLKNKIKALEKDMLNHQKEFENGKLLPSEVKNYDTIQFNYQLVINTRKLIIDKLEKQLEQK